MISARRLLLYVFVVVAFSRCSMCQTDDYEYTTRATLRPLVKRPTCSSYKTILSLEGGALRGILVTSILMEVENSIKRYFLDHPYYLPSGYEITSVDDFDVNLVDYFDCMTGLATGAWTLLYLASRGGQGASKRVFDDPAIVEQYGVIRPGEAAGLRVFYKEYGRVIYPQEAINISAGTPLDLSNPDAPGVSAPLYPLEGLETALEAFLGNTTLADLDTTVIVNAYDLMSGFLVLFVQNALVYPPVTSSAISVTRDRPRFESPGISRFGPDMIFDEGKDYFLKDVGTASGSAPLANRAKPLCQAYNDTVEFLMINGLIAIEDTAWHAIFFVASETNTHSLQNIAVLSIANGLTMETFSQYANSGVGDWLDNLRLSLLYNRSGQEALVDLLDYLFYSNPNTKPNQYLRVNTGAPLETEEGTVLRSLDNLEFLDDLEEIGTRVAVEYRDSIDAFIHDFIFC